MTKPPKFIFLYYQIWNTEDGQLLHTLYGHQYEIVCVAFDPQSYFIGTGSMDQTSKLWDVETGKEVMTLKGHKGEIVSLQFNTENDKLLTGSFDKTARVSFSLIIAMGYKVWSVYSRVRRARRGNFLHSVRIHRRIVCNRLNRQVTPILKQRTVKIWDVADGRCIETLRGHVDEVLDINFNATGTKLATASSDGTARLYNINSGACIGILNGHEGEISKVNFNPQGSKLLTASVDCSARIWNVETCEELQVLKDHSDEIFSCAFNYEGDIIITGSKDNTCKIWKDTLSK